MDCLYACARVAEESREHMRFVTYNIRYGLGRDGLIDLDRIAESVGQADVIALQEVEDRKSVV